MLEKIHIEKFKRIEKIDLELDRINILVGSNNSGKSSILQAIQFAIGTAQTALKNGGVEKSSKISYSGSTASFQYLPILEIEALIYDKKLTQNSGSTIKFKQKYTNLEMTVNLKRGKNRNISTVIEGIELYKEFATTEHPYCVFVPGLSGITLSEEFRSQAIVNKSATRGDSNLYLRNILYSLYNNEADWKQFQASVSIFFPDYSFSVEFNQSEDEHITVLVKHNDITLPLDAMGTSALQIVQILSYIFYFNPKFIILDEPDTHLHPNNQRRMMKELIRLSYEKDIQILLSTHSRHILDEVAGEGKVIWLNDGEIQKSEYQYTQLLLDLGALDKTDFLNNSNVNVVVCTEDEKQLEMLPSVLKSCGFDMDKTVIIPYYGCSKIDNARLLSAFMSKYAPTKSIIIHRDRDYLTDEDTDDYIKTLTTDKTKVFITTGTDVEAIFLNAEHINYLYSEITVEEATKLIEESIIEAKDTSIEKFINFVHDKTKERNVGKISRQCNELYNQSSLRYTYGKKTFGILKSKLQMQLKKTPDLFQVSEFIKQKSLLELATLSK